MNSGVAAAVKKMRAVTCHAHCRRSASAAVLWLWPPPAGCALQYFAYRALFTSILATGILVEPKNSLECESYRKERAEELKQEKKELFLAPQQPGSGEQRTPRQLRSSS